MRRLSRVQLPQFGVEHLLLLLIVIVAFSLRLNGVDWDSGYGFHPDERSLYMRAGCMYDLLTERPGHQQCLSDHPQIQPGLPDLPTLLDFDRSPLNPHWFPLGSVLIYVLVLCRSVIELFTDVSALDMRYVGRSLSALADVGTVIMVYVLGRRIYGRLYGPWAGLLAAALVAFAVIHVQNSHFFRPEAFSAFWALAVFWSILQVLERRRLRDSLLLGLFTGLAFAPKVSIAPILLPLALCYCLRLVDLGNGRLLGVPRRVLEQTFLNALAAGAVAVTTFFLVTPYGLLYLSNFLAEQAAQTNMANHAGLWPFTIQYVGTPAFFYQFKQTAVWGLGLPLGLIAWGSIIFTAILAWRGSFARRGDILILVWVVPSILLLESFEVRFQRYYFALIPFMILLGSRMLLWGPFYFQSIMGGTGRRRRLSMSSADTAPGTTLSGAAWAFLRQNPTGQRCMLAAAWAVVCLVLGFTIVYSLAFQSIYLNPHPAVAASQWINGHIPVGTSIISDNHWDEYVPELHAYDVWQFPAYEPDGVGKMAQLGGRLADAEYVVFYSQRPYVSVSSDPERFPLTLEYYRQLFGGELGYQFETAFSSHPSLAGITIRDDPFERTGLPRPGRWASLSDLPPPSPGISFSWGYADDNVVGYDHPTVMVFRNVERLPAEKLVGQLVRAEAGTIPALKFSGEDLARQQSGGTWSELFDRDSIANQAPTLAWLLVIEVIYLISLPLCLFIFRPLADRGLVLARIAGLLGVAYVTWVLVSLGWLDFSHSGILLGMAVVACLSGIVLALQWRQMWEFVRARWRVLAVAEVIFLGAFLVFTLIRAFNPDLWHPFRGGEKPMELAYFNAVIRSTLLPPYDPWFAGGYLNYYYWGYFILAIPTRLTGIVPTTAFNLAVPLLFALTVTGAFSVVYNLAEGCRRALRPARSPDGGVAGVEADSDYGGDYAVSPGHRFGPVERAIRSPISAGLMGALFVAVIGNLDGTIQLLQGVWGRLAGTGASIFAFDFWRSSRMLPNSESVEPNPFAFWLWGTGGSQPEVSWHITEFPFFSFLFADLHAHMMAIPFVILVVGLSLNFVVGFRRLGWMWDCLALGMLALALGSLWLINSWDYPSLLLLALAMVAVAAAGTWSVTKVQVTWGIALSVFLVAVSLVAFLPFHQSVETFGTGLEISRWKTPLVNFLGIHGLFLVIIGVFLAWQARRPLFLIVGDSFNIRYLDMAVETDTYRHSFRKWLRLFFWTAVAVAVLFVAAGYFTAATMVVFLNLTCLVAWDIMTSREAGRTYSVFPLILAALALGLIIGVDLVRVEDDIGRMNTVFKYYLEAWVMLALASAFFLWRIWYDSRFRPVPFDAAHLAWLGIVGALVLFSLVYTVLGTQARLADRFNSMPPTLDGTAYMNDAVHWEREHAIELKWDLEAINWLQDNVTGSPVILEAHTEQYRWGGRMANYTGLPTVLGWPWHQIQQRGPYGTEVHTRAADVRQIYTTDDLAEAKELLDDYGVRYVVVGDLERVFYPGEGLRKFDIMAQLGAAPKVFDNGHTAIYEIDPQVIIGN